MSGNLWEEMIALNVTSDRELTALGTPAEFRRTDGIRARFAFVRERLDNFLDKDQWPIPRPRTARATTATTTSRSG